MGRGDAANSGVASAAGPDGPVSARWTFEEHLVAGKAPVVVDGRLYVGTSDDEPALVALDAATGSETWRTTFEKGVGFPDAAAAVAGDVVLAPFEGVLAGVDAASGEVRWRRRLGDGVTAPVVADGTAYAGVGREGTVVAVDPASGQVAWEQSVGEYVPATVAVADGTVFALAGDEESGTLVALDAGTGEGRWTENVDRQPRTRPVLADGAVYLADEAGLRSFTRDAGARFDFTFDADAEAARYSRGGSAPAVADGTVYVGAPDGHLYAVDAATGEREWAFWTWNGVSGDPVVAGDTVYVASDDTFVYALDAADGARRWEFDTTGHPRGGGAAVVDGLLFVATSEDGLYALEES